MHGVSKHTKSLDCPEHPNQHNAVLYCAPSELVGIWDCPKSQASGVHDHDPETVEIDDELAVYVCGGTDGCGAELPGDPTEDAADIIANSRIDEMRGK